MAKIIDDETIENVCILAKLSLSDEAIEKAKEEAERLSEEALDRLHTLLGEDTFLEELSRSLVNRRK